VVRRATPNPALASLAHVGRWLTFTPSTVFQLFCCGLTYAVNVPTHIPVDNFGRSSWPVLGPRLPLTVGVAATGAGAGWLPTGAIEAGRCHCCPDLPLAHFVVPSPPLGPGGSAVEAIRLAWWNPVREPLADPLWTGRRFRPGYLAAAPSQPPPRPPRALRIRWLLELRFSRFQACHWPPPGKGSGGTIDPTARPAPAGTSRRRAEASRCPSPIDKIHFFDPLAAFVVAGGVDAPSSGRRPAPDPCRPMPVGLSSVMLLR